MALIKHKVYGELTIFIIDNKLTAHDLTAYINKLPSGATITEVTLKEGANAFVIHWSSVEDF